MNCGMVSAAYGGTCTASLIRGGATSVVSHTLHGMWDDGAGAGCWSATGEVGSIDTRLAIPDDIGIAFRLSEAGYPIRYRLVSASFHRAWRSDRGYLSLRWRCGQGAGGITAPMPIEYGAHPCPRVSQSIRNQL